MKKPIPETEKENTYSSRESWPPYTYRDYQDIAPETYKSFMEFLSTENTSNKVMELQPWISFCDSRYILLLPKQSLFQQHDGTIS